MALNLEQEQLAAWRAFLEAHSTVIGALEREMQEEQGLPLTWYDVLVHLSEAPGSRLSHKSVAESVVLSRSGITRLVDRMAAAGLVRREPSPDDRRVSHVVMTEEGLGALQRAAPGHIRGVVEHFARHLNTEDVPVFQSFFARVLREGKRGPAQDAGSQEGDSPEPGSTARLGGW